MIVSWNTTNACNLKCRHCYRDAGAKAEEELSTAEGLALIDGIAGAGFKIMIFSGGEPLMRPDIHTLARHAVQRGLRPVFGTNGTLIDVKEAARLKESGAMAMGISLDSVSPEKHDGFRGVPGAWQRAVEGMEACRKAGLPFQLHTTVVDWNADEIEDITDLALKAGAAAHHFFFLVPTGRGADIEGQSLREDRYEEILERIMRKQGRVDIELKPTCAPQFMRIARQLGVPTRFSRGCLAGTAYCIVSPVGNVQPCAYLDIKAGNVRERSFGDIWRDNPVFNRLRTMEYGGGCGLCQYKKICGGCRARALYYHGDYMAEEPWCLFRSSVVSRQS